MWHYNALNLSRNPVCTPQLLITTLTKCSNRAQSQLYDEVSFVTRYVNIWYVSCSCVLFVQGHYAYIYDGGGGFLGYQERRFRIRMSLGFHRAVKEIFAILEFYAMYIGS
jgi:hypothetical protein